MKFCTVAQSEVPCAINTHRSFTCCSHISHMKYNSQIPERIFSMKKALLSQCFFWRRMCCRRRDRRQADVHRTSAFDRFNSPPSPPKEMPPEGGISFGGDGGIWISIFTFFMFLCLHSIWFSVVILQFLILFVYNFEKLKGKNKGKFLLIVYTLQGTNAWVRTQAFLFIRYSFTYFAV